MSSVFPLVNVINMKHVLIELAQRINWKSVEKDFVPYYVDMGRPAIPIRKMVGFMLLKQMYNQSDNAFVDRWIENSYWQYFHGETFFPYEKSFDPSEHIHFRKRLGTERVEKLLMFSLNFFKALKWKKKKSSRE